MSEVYAIKQIKNPYLARVSSCGGSHPYLLIHGYSIFEN